MAGAGGEEKGGTFFFGHEYKENWKSTKRREHSGRGRKSNCAVSGEGCGIEWAWGVKIMECGFSGFEDEQCLKR